MTVCPALTNFATISGTSATRRSPAARSFGTAIFMRAIIGARTPGPSVPNAAKATGPGPGASPSFGPYACRTDPRMVASRILRFRRIDGVRRIPPEQIDDRTLEDAPYAL